MNRIRSGRNPVSFYLNPVYLFALIWLAVSGPAIAVITPTTNTGTLLSTLQANSSNITIVGGVTITNNVTGNLNNVGSGVGTFTNEGGLTGGIVLRSGSLNSNRGAQGVAPFNYQTCAACDTTTVEFDIKPNFNNIGIKYSFYSWEYPEYVCTGFNDNIDVLISGPGITGTANIAQIPNTVLPIQINTVNPGAVGVNGGTPAAPNCQLGNSAFFVRKGCSLLPAPAGCSTNDYDYVFTTDAYREMDGGTLPLSNFLPVAGGQTYHVKLVINDVADNFKDSQMFFSLLTSQAPNTSISKSVSSTGPVSRGTQLTYTVKLSNQGFSSDVVNVTDAIPANSTYVAGSASNGGSLSGSTLSWSNVTVPAATCANVDCSTVNPGVLNLTFKVTVTGGPQVQNSASFSTTLPYTPTSTVSNTVTTTVDSDHGDAPNGTVAGVLYNFGDSAHVVPTTPTVFLGSSAPDDDSQTNLALWQSQATATGDDSTATADEGIAQLLSSGASTFPVLLSSATSYSLTLRCSGPATAGTVSGWIDFNQNHVFDGGERAQGACSAASNGTVTLTWTGLSGIVGGTTYARFRIASLAADVSNPSGIAADGEAEDYPLTATVPPKVTVNKISIGGVNTFSFTGNNGLPTSATPITTNTAGTSATAPAVTNVSLTALNTATTITEGALPAGYVLTAASCTGLRSGDTATLSGNTLTIPATSIIGSAVINCTFTNTKQAQLTVTKLGVGGGAAFDFSITGGLTPATFTLNPNPPTTPTASQVFTNIAPSTSIVVTETSLGNNFSLTDIACSNASGAPTGSNITVDIANKRVTVVPVPGADINCTFSNVKSPKIVLTKQSVGGDATFGFTAASSTAGTSMSSSAPTILTVAGTGSVNLNVNGLRQNQTTNVTLTENDPTSLGYANTIIACTDILTNSPVGTVTINSRQVVLSNVGAGAEISCKFTNQKKPAITIKKQSVGGTGNFSFTGGTNGLPASLSLNTGTSNPISSTAYTITSLSSSASITETIPSDWLLTSANCVDASLTPVTSTLSGGTLTLPSSSFSSGSDITCTFVNSRKATITVNKISVGGTGSFTFTGTNGLPGTATTITTSTPNTSATTAVLTNVPLSALNTLTAITEGPLPSGFALTGASCTGLAGGDSATLDSLTRTLSVPATSITAGANINCTFTNSKLPTVTVNKISQGGTGTFNFTGTNGLPSVATSITTTTAGSPATTSTLTNVPLTTLNTGTTITEASLAGYVLTGANCTGLQSGDTATLIGNTLSIPANSVTIGAAISCTFTNAKLPTVTVNKISLGGVDSFAFTGSNGLPAVPVSVTTTTAGNPASAPALTNVALTDLNTATTITEAGIAPGYLLTAASCTGLNGSDTPVLSGNTLSIPSTSIIIGANINCTFTNTRQPTITIKKISIDGVDTFGFIGTNGLPNRSTYITTTVPGTPAASPDLTSIILTSLNTETTITENFIPTGYALTDANCTGLNGSDTAVLSGSSLTIPASSILSGADIECTFTNTKQAVSAVSGTVFKDVGISGGIANNAIQDGAEVGISGVTVKLTDCNATIYASVTTGGDGSYRLSTASVPAGTVCVEQSNLSGYLSTGINVEGDTTPSGYTLVSTDKISFTLAANTEYSGINFGDVPVSQLLTDGAQIGVGGTVLFYSHTFIAGSGGNVTFSLPGATSSPNLPGWSEVLYTDTNCNGVLDSGETQTSTTAISVIADQQLCLLIKENIPEGAPLGATNLVTIQADFVYTGATPALSSSLTRQDLTTVSDSSVKLIKQVRNVTTDGAGTPNWQLNNTGKSGDILEYRITYTNNSATEISTLIVRDATPAYTTFVSALAELVLPPNLTGCLKKTPTAATPIACNNADTSGGTGNLEWTFTGALASGASGNVRFQVKID